MGCGRHRSDGLCSHVLPHWPGADACPWGPCPYGTRACHPALSLVPGEGQSSFPGRLIKGAPASAGRWSLCNRRRCSPGKTCHDCFFLREPPAPALGWLMTGAGGHDPAGSFLLPGGLAPSLWWALAQDTNAFTFPVHFHGPSACSDLRHAVASLSNSVPTLSISQCQSPSR